MNKPTLSPIPFTEADLNGTLVERLNRVAGEIAPDHLAYHDLQVDLTYGQLFEKAHRLAAGLAYCIGPDASQEQQLVALLLSPDWSETVGLLATILAGHYYVAFDPLQDAEKHKPYFAEYRIRAVITTQGNLDIARNLVCAADTEIPILCVDDLPDAPPVYAIPAQHNRALHSVYFTSGSTGKPRGVLRTHGGMLHTAYLSSVDLGFTPADKITLTMPIALGMSLTATLGALLNGVTICRRNDALLNPRAFYDWLREDEITIARASAGMIRSLTLLPDEFVSIPSLRLVDTGGEAFTQAEIARLFRLTSPSGMLNIRLASNEAGNYAMFRVRAGEAWAGEKNKAGYPPRFVQVLVVDENRNPLPPGQDGELAVRSRYLAAGYIHEPAQTAARFESVSNGEQIYYTGDMGRILEDGCIEFLGRKDFRVKVRGYTVELEAVEAGLKKLDHVRDAAATVQDLPNGNRRLVGCLVLEKGYSLSTRSARQQLVKHLPDHMIPSVLQVVESIPLTPTGKVDRKALPMPALDRSNLGVEYRAPDTTQEADLVHIWEQVLSIPKIGLDDDFFDLGGDSLLAANLFAAVEKHFGRRYFASVLLEHRTPGQLAGYMLDHPDGDEGVLSRLRSGGSKKPLIILPGGMDAAFVFRNMLPYFDADRPVYAFELSRVYRQTQQETPIPELAAGLIKTLKQAQPEGPYYILGYSFGGLVAFELACQLRQAGETVGLLALLDTLPPGKTLFSFSDRFWNYHLPNFRKLDWAGRRDYVFSRIHRVWMRLSALRIFRPLTRKMFQSTVRIRHVVSNKYMPGIFAGDLLLFSTEHKNLHGSQENHLAWKNHATGQFTAVMIPGEHKDLMVDPYVQPWAEKLSQSVLQLP